MIYVHTNNRSYLSINSLIFIIFALKVASYKGVNILITSASQVLKKKYIKIFMCKRVGKKRDKNEFSSIVRLSIISYSFYMPCLLKLFLLSSLFISNKGFISALQLDIFSPFTHSYCDGVKTEFWSRQVVTVIVVVVVMVKW